MFDDIKMIRTENIVSKINIIIQFNIPIHKINLEPMLGQRLVNMNRIFKPTWLHLTFLRKPKLFSTGQPTTQSIDMMA